MTQAINYRGNSPGISGHTTTLSRLFRGSQRLSVSNSRYSPPISALFVTRRSQNLFFLALRPRIPDMELSPFQIRYAGQSKYADLAGARSSLVIEVKYVKDASSAPSVTKQLPGLADLYSQQPLAKAILFIIVVAHGAEWDSVKIDRGHSNLGRLPVILTRSIRLPPEPQ